MRLNVLSGKIFKEFCAACHAEQPVIDIHAPHIHDKAEKLERMSEESHTSKSDVLRKAIYLMDIAIDSKKQGNKLAVVNKDGGKLITEIVGI